MKKIDFINKYGEEAYKSYLEKVKLCRQKHKEQVAEYNKQYYQDNKKKFAEHNKQYYQEHKEDWAEYNKQYRQTPKGRAIKLYNAYMTADNNANREFTAPPITSSYIVDRIFTSTCTYCGESDWTKLGCDRIDNSLPHQEGNVVCCCGKCNVERNNMSVEEFIKKKEVS